MQLDIELARRILLIAEAAPANQHVGRIEIPDVDHDVVLEHLELLSEAGLIEAMIRRNSMGGSRNHFAFVNRLTWDGHEFLANAKNEQVWEKTKTFLKDKGGTMSMAVVKAVVIKIAGQHLGIAV